MTKRAATVLMILLAAAMCVVIAAVGLTAWLFVSVVDSDVADEPSAARAFEEVRQRFGNVGPVVDLTEDNLVVKRKPPTARPREVRSLHILAWDADDERLTEATLPFWLLRLKRGPVNLSSGATHGGVRWSRNVAISVEDVERYGPALLVDEIYEGTRFLVWSE